MSLIINESCFMSESKIIVNKKSTGKVIIETYLQEADSPNQNLRIYGKDLISESLDKQEEFVKSRRFLGELDHPISDNPIRQTTVLYKDASHIITEMGWEGNLLKGVVETMDYTPNGKIMGGMIRDRIPVGFSLRALADVQSQGQYKKVIGPMITICYDCVSKPSNHKAIMTEIKMEHATQIIQESSQSICTEDGKCYLPNYFDMLVEQEIIKLKKRFW